METNKIKNKTIMETEKFKAVENLEIGKDYIARDCMELVIDRRRGF